MEKHKRANTKHPDMICLTFPISTPNFNKPNHFIEQKIPVAIQLLLDRITGLTLVLHKIAGNLRQTLVEQGLKHDCSNFQD
jgi:hypothetical protein